MIELYISLRKSNVSGHHINLTIQCQDWNWKPPKRLPRTAAELLRITAYRCTLKLPLIAMVAFSFHSWLFISAHALFVKIGTPNAVAPYSELQIQLPRTAPEHIRTSAHRRTPKLPSVAMVAHFVSFIRYFYFSLYGFYQEPL